MSGDHTLDRRSNVRLRRVDFDRPGYTDWTITSEVTSGATVQVNAYLQLLPASLNGGIAVSSNPAGASVYLDDQYKGVTTAYDDLDLTGMPAGSHTISVRLDGYDEYRITVQVTPDATVKVRARLAPAGGPNVTATTTSSADRGAIQANSTPSGARVALDGTYKGTAPLSITDVPTGPRTVRFSLDGYAEREQQVDELVDVQAGQTATLSPNLTPLERSSSSSQPSALQRWRSSLGRGSDNIYAIVHCFTPTSSSTAKVIPEQGANSPRCSGARCRRRRRNPNSF